MDRLIALERTLHSPENRKNRDLVTRLLHPDFREVGTSGTSYDRQSIIKLMEQEDASDWQIHSQDFESSLLSENICLLLYKTCLLQPAQMPKGFAKRVSVWIKNTDNWQIQYHQGTPCDEFALSSMT